MKTTKPSSLFVTLIFGLFLFGPLASVQAEEFRPGPGKMQMHLGIIKQYLDVVNSYHDIASSPEKSAAFNLQQLENVYKKQGKREEIFGMYTRLLKESKNRTLRNLAYMKLSEVYRKTGQHAKAEDLIQKALAENIKAIR
ncbi:MAG: hypothetical protein BMS9Abin06_0982 [Gammaproteobacteria bacterium]|nr:MAG: hypothetical protein BMS9Abin06_0982 [Gammaproteobacteria bacterium]